MSPIPTKCRWVFSKLRPGWAASAMMVAGRIKTIVACLELYPFVFCTFVAMLALHSLCRPTIKPVGAFVNRRVLTKLCFMSKLSAKLETRRQRGPNTL